MEIELLQEASQRIYVDCSTDNVDHISEANRLVLPYIEGYADAKEMWAKLYHLKTIIDEAEKIIKDRLVDDLATQYGKESFQVAGLEVSVKKGAGRWSYPNNPVIDDLKSKVKQAEELAKIASKSKQDQVWVETGEMITAAVYNENKDTLQTKIIK